jgi:hypothetical protein
VNDTRSGNPGYSITVAATAPTVDGSTSAAGTGAQLTLTPVTPIPASSNPAAIGPVATSPQALSTIATTIVNTVAGTGQGEWAFPADSGATESLAIVIPGDASAGAYRSTLTFTNAPPVASRGRAVSHAAPHLRGLGPERTS